MSDPLDLTGGWTGIYNYPEPHPPNGFEAVLRDEGGAITGETRERSDSAEDMADEQCAMLSGTRSGRSVSFVKIYDELHRAEHPVRYEGTVSAEGDEIAGRWSIPGVWSGSFLMVRASGRAESVERAAHAETD